MKRNWTQAGNISELHTRAPSMMFTPGESSKRRGMCFRCCVVCRGVVRAGEKSGGDLAGQE
jgi:hypothetical protein